MPQQLIDWKVGGGFHGDLAAGPGACVFLQLLIAYWWISYGCKLTLGHSISLLTSPSQPGLW